MNEKYPWSQPQKCSFPSPVRRNVVTTVLSKTEWQFFSVRLTKVVTTPFVRGWQMSQQSPRCTKYKNVNIQIRKQLATWGVGAIDFDVESTTQSWNRKHQNVALASRAQVNRRTSLSGFWGRERQEPSYNAFCVCLPGLQSGGDLGLDRAKWFIPLLHHLRKTTRKHLLTPSSIIINFVCCFWRQPMMNSSTGTLIFKEILYPLWVTTTGVFLPAQPPPQFLVGVMYHSPNNYRIISHMRISLYLITW